MNPFHALTKRGLFTQTLHCDIYIGSKSLLPGPPEYIPTSRYNTAIFHLCDRLHCKLQNKSFLRKNSKECLNGQAQDWLRYLNRWRKTLFPICREHHNWHGAQRSRYWDSQQNPWTLEITLTSSAHWLTVSKARTCFKTSLPCSSRRAWTI